MKLARKTDGRTRMETLIWKMDGGECSAESQERVVVLVGKCEREREKRERERVRERKRRRERRDRESEKDEKRRDRERERGEARRWKQD